MPTVAIRLLERLGIDRSLSGDLAEASTMHTRLWVWPQAVSAVVVALVGDVRSHPILAARGVVFGLLLRVAHMALWSQLWRYVNPVIGAAVRGAGLRACGGFIVTGA